MTEVLYTNNATALLSAGILAGDTSITVSDGTAFPAPTGTDYFYLTIQSASHTEIVKVTARTGNNLTVVRAQQGTTAAAFDIATGCSLRVTAGGFADLYDTIALKQDPLTGVTGVVDPATGIARAIIEADVPALPISKTTGLQTALDAKLRSALATYAELTAIASADRTNGMKVYVSARATAGDGGEGWWRFDSASSTTADGGTVLAPDSGTGRWLRVYAPGRLRLAWFGFTTAAFSAGIAAAKAASAWLDAEGQTVTLTSLINLTGAGVYKWANLSYEKLTQTATNAENAITITGAGFDSPRSLSANASVGATSITLSDASGLAAGDIFYLMHDSEWVPAYDVVTVAAGQWITAVAVNTGTGVITLNAPLQTSFTTGNAARVYKFNQTCEIWMDNVTARGGGTGLEQGGMRINWGTIYKWDNVRSYGNEYTSFDWQMCVDKYQKGSTYSEGSTLDGYGYGHVLGGCYNAGLLSVSGADARHMATIGASVQAGLPGGTNLYFIGQGTRIAQVHCDNARGDPFDVHFGERAYWVGSITGNMLPGTGESALTLQSPDGTIDSWNVTGGDQGGIIQCWGKPSDEPAPYFNIGKANLGRGGTSTNFALLVENFDDVTRRVMNIDIGAFGASYPGLIVLDCEEGGINMHIGHLTGVSRTTHTVYLVSSANGRPRLTISRNDATEDSGNASVYLVNADGSAWRTANPGTFGAFCDILTGSPGADNTAYHANDALITTGQSRGTITAAKTGAGFVTPGSYTPTGTIVSNVDSVTPGLAYVKQEGNQVTVSGIVTVNLTATGDFSIGLSLPFPSAFTVSTDAFGVAAATSAAGYGAVFADATNDRLTLTGSSTLTDDRTWRYTVTYLLK